jgi:hypothetical protein
MAADRYGNILEVNEQFPSVVHSPASPESKERCKWEAQNSMYGYGRRPYVKRDWPMMWYLAGRPLDERGEPKMGPDTIIEQVEIESEEQTEYHRSRGFRPTPLEALEVFKKQQTEFASLAANLEYQKKNQLSPRAAAEVEAAQDASATHLPMVPETPIRSRAR